MAATVGGGNGLAAGHAPVVEGEGGEAVRERGLRGGAGIEGRSATWSVHGFKGRTALEEGETGIEGEELLVECKFLFAV